MIFIDFHAISLNAKLLHVRHLNGEDGYTLLQPAQAMWGPRCYPRLRFSVSKLVHLS